MVYQEQSEIGAGEFFQSAAFACAKALALIAPNAKAAPPAASK
jgi:hypothetical protein